MTRERRSGDNSLSRWGPLIYSSLVGPIHGAWTEPFDFLIAYYAPRRAARPTMHTRCQQQFSNICLNLQLQFQTNASIVCRPECTQDSSSCEGSGNLLCFFFGGGGDKKAEKEKFVLWQQAIFRPSLLVEILIRIQSQIWPRQ